MERSFLRTLVLSAAVTAGAILAAPSEARADGAVSPNGKGIVGGALLGGEIVTMPMGIAGLKPWWPYLVFGGLGSVGGAIGGWGVERATAGTTDATTGKTTGGTAEPALYMLAGGLALIIPTLVVSLNATTRSKYKEEPAEPGAAPATAPGAAPPGAPPGDGTTVTVTKTSDARKAMPRPRHVGLVAFDPEGFQLGIPAVSIKPMYSAVELSQYGVSQKTEVNIPVVSASF